MSPLEFTVCFQQHHYLINVTFILVSWYSSSRQSNISKLHMLTLILGKIFNYNLMIFFQVYVQKQLLITRTIIWKYDLLPIKRTLYSSLWEEFSQCNKLTHRTAFYIQYYWTNRMLIFHVVSCQNLHESVL